jgi:hypothetical protein
VSLDSEYYISVLEYASISLFLHKKIHGNKQKTMEGALFQNMCSMCIHFDIIDCITHAAVGSFVEALEFYI